MAQNVYAGGYKLWHSDLAACYYVTMCDHAGVLLFFDLER